MGESLHRWLYKKDADASQGRNTVGSGRSREMQAETPHLTPFQSSQELPTSFATPPLLFHARSRGLVLKTSSLLYIFSCTTFTLDYLSSLSVSFHNPCCLVKPGPGHHYHPFGDCSGSQSGFLCCSPSNQGSVFKYRSSHLLRVSSPVDTSCSEVKVHPSQPPFLPGPPLSRLPPHWPFSQPKASSTFFQDHTFSLPRICFPTETDTQIVSTLFFRCQFSSLGKSPLTCLTR